MAESSVQSAVQWLGSLLVEEEDNLRPIKEKVEQLRDELDWMHCFLREADASRYVDPRVGRWVVQIQEIAYEAEEVVENFLFKLISHQKQEYAGKTFVIKNKLERYLWVFGEAKAVNDASNEIEALRAKVATLTSRLQAYGVKITRLDTVSSTTRVDSNGLDGIKEGRLIGVDDQIKKIVSDLVAGTGENRVVGIWGKSGVGKTTLAKEVYFDHAIRKHFERFSWVNVPRNGHISGLLRGVLTSIATKSIDEIGIMTDQELINELYEVLLEKKCLVVLDNVWSFDVWDDVKVAFPEDDDKDSGSKILFTTENQLVVEEMLSEGAFIHEKKCLSYDQSWELLQSKLGGLTTQIFGNDGTPKMIEMVKKMLKFCQGIPLSVVALGGLLATKETPEEWEHLLDLMSSHHNAKNQQQSYEKVVELCYYDLPYYLKNCFLQLGSFPEDFEIPTKKLCNMWVAEGIVVAANTKVSRQESSLDKLAENCLSELLQRGMVQLSKRKSSDGNVKSCRLHDLMRCVCLKVSKEENFLSIMDFNNVGEVVTGKIRRLAMYLGEEGKEITLPQKNLLIRSLLVFSSQKERPEVNHGSVKALCRDSQLLRVLDLQGVVVSSKTLPREIGDLIYLRYLSLRDMLLTKLPPTIGCLRWLETLDLRAKVRLEIPNVLWCLERLKHLYLPYYFTIKDSEKLRLDNLKNLLTLKNVNYFIVQDVLAMKDLRKASIRYMHENEHIEFIQKSPKIEFGLTIFRAIIGKEHINALISFNNLIKLELKGEVTEPLYEFRFPPNLKKLVLDFCGLMQDPMPVLEKLPNLTSLCLDHQAYVGQTMVCSPFGFPKLTYLRLQGLKSLQVWVVAGNNSAMPNLKCVEIKCCERLKMLPHEKDLPQQVQIVHI